MKYKMTISILLFFKTALIVFGQTSNDLIEPKYEKVGEAYGYLRGQEYSLDAIKDEFPQLERSIWKARKSFESTFGKSKEGMQLYLTEYLGPDNFSKFDEYLTSELIRTLGNQIYTVEEAISFISEVESRAKGNIPSPVLETLLSFQFSERPQDELIMGFTTVFKTKGHPKSKNTDWQIKVPKSWIAEEADRPNIIQKFRSGFGAGHQTIMLMVKEIPLTNEYEITTKEVDHIFVEHVFTEEAMKDWVPVGGRFISFKQMTFDNNIGCMIEFESATDRLDIEIRTRAVQFVFIRDTKIYMLSCAVSSEKNDTDLSLEMEKYLPLFLLVANSIVVNDQYE
jgi:hypothetical protein